MIFKHLLKSGQKFDLIKYMCITNSHYIGFYQFGQKCLTDIISH